MVLAVVMPVVMVVIVVIVDIIGGGRGVGNNFIIGNSRCCTVGYSLTSSCSASSN